MSKKNFEIVVNHPGAVKGYTSGDVITDPSEALIERARASSLLTLRKAGGGGIIDGPTGDQRTEDKTGRGV